MLAYTYLPAVLKKYSAMFIKTFYGLLYLFALLQASSLSNTNRWSKPA